MKNFKSIQNILKESSNLELSQIKKIYLLGTTGAGKTSLVRTILDTNKYAFPTTSQTKTTVTPTEYIVKKDLKFKTTIILKEKAEIQDSIELLIDAAIKKASDNYKQKKSNMEDIIDKLLESGDGKFRLRYMVTSEIIKEKASDIIDRILPLIKDLDDNESLLDNISLRTIKQNIVQDFFEEIEITFNKLNIDNYELFSNKPLIIEGISEKKDFIYRNKELLKNDFSSMVLLAEYIRIEGDNQLLANWLPQDLEFVLIDGEGIGHTLSEKRDTLSVRHYDFFDYCNQILLVGKALEPFIAGGQGAIESIYINGYKDKLKLLFSKMDEVENSDKNGFLRRQLSNLEDALEKQNISFNIQNKDTYKLEKLNENQTLDISKETIKNLFKDIKESKNPDFQSLYYDFNNFLIDLNTEKFILDFQKEIDYKHWMTIKAFTKRMQQEETEFRDIKPISKILTFIMRNINLFLKHSKQLKLEIAFSQNKIKQELSQKLRKYIYDNLICNNNHLWQQAYEEKGIGSHKRRKNFIFKNILKDFIPSQNSNEFKRFKQEIKSLLLQSGAKELASATKIILDSVEMKQIYKEKNFSWKVSEDINILIAKNGVGKSTILKLIDACIRHDMELIDDFQNPSIELSFLQYYESDFSDEIPTPIPITNNQTAENIKSVLIDTFDNKVSTCEDEHTELDCQIKKLFNDFSDCHSMVKTNIKKETEETRRKIEKIEEKIAIASIEELQEFQRLRTEENKIKNEMYKQFLLFQDIINTFYSDTNKEIIIDDIKISNSKIPLLIKFKNQDINSPTEENNEWEFIKKLSSGEKQILIIFLSIIIQGETPFILLMDEPETSLHVEWQSILIENIRKLNPNVQIIIATHNPIMLLDREASEIGTIDINDEEGVVQTDGRGTKYSDICSVLLNYFGLSSLIGSSMQKDIQEFTKLKLREDNLSTDESEKLEELHNILDNSLVGDIIYNSKYFLFLKYLEEHKEINFEKYETIDDNEMERFLEEFGEFFND
ncbi:MAG: AAA family ATPase [Sulfurovum sp.]